jgi:hypothetical protein
LVEHEIFIADADANGVDRLWLRLWLGWVMLVYLRADMAKNEVVLAH